MLAGVLLGIILTIRLFPETPAARLLHRYLVEQPLQLLSRTERHRLIFYLLLATLLLAPELAATMMIAPELLLGFAWDLSLYLDALAVTYAIAALSHVRTVARAFHLRRSIRRRSPVVKAGGRPRAHRIRKPRKPTSNEHEGSPAFALAA